MCRPNTFVNESTYKFKLSLLQICLQVCQPRWSLEGWHLFIYPSNIFFLCNGWMILILPTSLFIGTCEQFLFLQPLSLEGLILFIIPTTLSFGMNGIFKNFHHSNHLKKLIDNIFSSFSNLKKRKKWVDIFFHSSIPTIISMNN